MEPLRIFWNRSLKHSISPGKLAAHAAHAALAAYGIRYEHPIVVLMGSKSKIEAMPVAIRDAGKTELEPGTITTGAERVMGFAGWKHLSTESEEFKKLPVGTVGVSESGGWLLTHEGWLSEPPEEFPEYLRVAVRS